MRVALKKIKRCAALCLCAALFMTTNQIASAQETEDRDIMQEYLDKAAAGVEIYPLVDEEGVLFGYYEPYSEDDINAVMPLYSSNIEWTVEPQHCRKGANVYTLGNGNVINVSISASAAGTSYLGLVDTATDQLHIFTETKSTSGWFGKITMSTFATSTYSFCILNDSDITITYTGSYSL